MVNYYSLDGLSTRTNDLLNVFIMPFLNIYLVISYLISTIILSNNKLKGDINKYFLVFSITGLSYFIMSNSLSITRCGSLCRWGYDYYSKLFEWFVYLYIGKSAEIFCILCQISVLKIKFDAFSAENRTKTTNNNISVKKFLLIISIYWIISLIFYVLPNFYGRSIVQIGYLVSNQTTETMNNETIFSVVKRPLYIIFRDEREDLFNKFVQLFFPTILLIFYLIIMILNMIILIKFKRFLAIKTATVSGNSYKIYSIRLILIDN